MTTTTSRPAETGAPAGDGAPERAVTGKLRGSLGVASIVFIVVAAASPLGVIGGPVPLGIAFGNGAGFPTTFLVVTAILLFFAVGFTAATPYVRSAGAFYAYVDKGVGRGAGLGTAFSALLSYLVLEAGVFGLFGPAVDGLLQSYGLPAVPWFVYAAVGFVIVSALAYFNIELSGRVLAVLLIGEVLIVLALDAAVIFSGGGPEGFSTAFADPAQIVSGAPGFAILFAILSFIGFEATAVFRDEAKDPDRTIPRATYIALISIGVFYAISSWALISANGESTIVEKATENPGGILASTTEVVPRHRRRAHHPGALRHEPLRVHPVVPQHLDALLLLAGPQGRDRRPARRRAPEARLARPRVARHRGDRGRAHARRRAAAARPDHAVLHLARRHLVGRLRAAAHPHHDRRDRHLPEGASTG